MSVSSTSDSTASAEATPVTDAAANPTATTTSAAAKADAGKGDEPTTERRTQPVTMVFGSFGIKAGETVRVTPTQAEQFRAAGLAR